MESERELVLAGERLRLEAAAPRHREAAEEMKREFFAAGERVINGSALFDRMPFAEWLEAVRRGSRPETARADWAVADSFFAVRKRDGRMVGVLDLRHSLATPFLREYGGHIGYSVRPSERRKGYATEMLRLALRRCAALGIGTARLGCYTANIASARTIERCGGVRVEEKPYLDGEPMTLYAVATGGEG